MSLESHLDEMTFHATTLQLRNHEEMLLFLLWSIHPRMRVNVPQQNTFLGAGLQQLIHQIETVVTDADVVGEAQGFLVINQLPERVATVDHHVENDTQRPNAGLVSVILFP